MRMGICADCGHAVNRCSGCGAMVCADCCTSTKDGDFCKECVTGGCKPQQFTRL